MPLQIRRGLEAERTQITPTNGLVEGELLYVTDDKKLYIGTGSVGEHQGLVITGFNAGDAKDAAADAFADGEHTNITFTYDDEAKSLSAAVNLSDYIGTIKADAFKGSVVADDSTILVDSVEGVLRGTLVGTVTGNVTGNVVGNVTGNVTGNVAGNVVGNVTGSLEGDVTGSVFADDSTILVDGVDGRILGPVFSNVTGNLLSSTGSTIINNTTRSATLNEITLEGSATITGNPVFVANLISIVAGTPSLTEPVLAVASITSSNNLGGSLSLTRGRGTLVSPSIVENGDEVGSLEFGAHDGSGFVSVANIIASVNGTVSFGQPAPVDLAVNVSNGTAVNTVATIKSSQIEFVVPPKLPVVADDTARTTLIPTAAAGMLIFMQSGTTPAATNTVQVFDGTNWVNLT